MWGPCDGIDAIAVAAIDVAVIVVAADNCSVAAIKLSQVFRGRTVILEADICSIAVRKTTNRVVVTVVAVVVVAAIVVVVTHLTVTSGWWNG